MDVEVIQVRIVSAVAGELNLKLKLILRDGQAAHGACGADPRTAPGPIRWLTREIAILDRSSGLLA